MDVALIVVSVTVALCVGLASGLAYRASSGQPPPAEPDPARLPPGVGQVLSVLRSLAVVVDADDGVVRASPAAYAFGIVRGERVVPDELVGLVRSVRRDGRIRAQELELPRGPVGGGTLSFSARVAPLGMRHTLLLVEDRTDAKRVDAVRRDFVANVSHELKTPVGALRLLAEAVQDASDDPEAVRRFSERMQHESTRLSQLVQELIDLSRLESQDPLREPHPVAVDEVVHSGLERSRELAGARGIELVAECESGLKVLGSEAQLAMAMGNLIDNAVSYSAENAKVGLTVRRAGNLAEITVTDQGIGIPGRDLQRIFERFYRVDTARSRRTGGTGLGLSIVKHIAQNHGGDIRVWSIEGAGSTFTLRLPLMASTGTGAEHGPADDRGPKTSSERKTG